MLVIKMGVCVFVRNVLFCGAVVISVVKELPEHMGVAITFLKYLVY